LEITSTHQGGIMLKLEQDDRQEILQAFQIVVAYLQKESDAITLTALKELTEGSFKDSVAKMDEAILFDKLLTDIRSCLSSEYQKVAAVH